MATGTPWLVIICIKAVSSVYLGPVFGLFPAIYTGVFACLSASVIYPVVPSYVSYSITLPGMVVFAHASFVRLGYATGLAISRLVISPQLLAAT